MIMAKSVNRKKEIQLKLFNDVDEEAGASRGSASASEEVMRVISEGRGIPTDCNYQIGNYERPIVSVAPAI
jgi:hypothetical protein